jgi:hypothetical protein
VKLAVYLGDSDVGVRLFCVGGNLHPTYHINEVPLLPPDNASTFACVKGAWRPLILQCDSHGENGGKVG